ncbi:MAG: hypothetical protein PHT40_04825 [Patescibacteria group bacterium]|jgi:hypothetical protein|nr:hypothetical protein [Patescibacteria group bacterium]
MKNYASKRAKHGKLAYRTSSQFRFKRWQEVSKKKSENFLKKKNRLP